MYAHVSTCTFSWQQAVLLAKAEAGNKGKYPALSGRTALGNATNREISKQEVKVHIICSYVYKSREWITYPLGAYVVQKNERVHVCARQIFYSRIHSLLGVKNWSFVTYLCTYNFSKFRIIIYICISSSFTTSIDWYHSFLKETHPSKPPSHQDKENKVKSPKLILHLMWGLKVLTPYIRKR